ncbi:NUDIX hydrolase [Natronoglycomyces albus]|uniref:NUDIX domain-containing protein n=1 Tax=Natronoglycomyces albus TaxID=2811108 RepID=A0A895XKD8_9ACTN|nr:NUDIX domain-containing protein [Natronoglycomyces albus]QSB05804.1 NUDIX domain-containing protein [Natronoglycomyces albus]
METPPAHLEYRPSARIILANRRDEILLFNENHPVKGPLWFTVGGRLEPDETPMRAAVRELKEETGLVVAPDRLGQPIATSRGEWEYRGRQLWSYDTFFFLRVDELEVDDSGMEDYEFEQIASHRWWPVGELETTTALIFPGEFAWLARRLVSGETWDEPVKLPWFVA